MYLCKVIGSVVATRQREVFRPCKLLIVRETDTRGNLRSETAEMLALDFKLSAGIGDYVLVAREGRAVADVMGKKHVPANVVIVAVVDDWDVKE